MIFTESSRGNGTPLSGAGCDACSERTGFKWRKARVVLTSTDPEYTQKVRVIKEVLAASRADEAFFSIDEYGPFQSKGKVVVRGWHQTKATSFLGGKNRRAG